VYVLSQVSWKRVPKRVRVPSLLNDVHARFIFFESRSLGLERKLGDKFHLKLNTDKIPIAYKYREGKMKRTLKRELKGTEIAKR
jgi:hypothetical protein